jgi:ABC-type phosphate transport system substrate-binding protein
MTRPTRSISILTDARRRPAALAVALAALALLGAAGAATAQTDRPTVVVTDGETTADGTTTVGIVVTSLPDGLSGYYLDVTVADPGIARIESASYPDRFGLTSEPVLSSDGTTVTLEAADLEGAIEPGATDVTLATVTVSGAASGEAELTVEPRQFDADDGSAFAPATRAGAVAVSGGGGDGGAPTAADGGSATTGGVSDPVDDGDPRQTDEADDGPTSGLGPLSPVLVGLAVGLLIAVGVRRA